MPKIGQAPTVQKQELSNVQMGGRRNTAKTSPTAEVVEANKGFDSKLVNKLTGYKEKSIYKEGRHNEIGKDEFLKLLSHQLQHQDPMNPMDQSKFSGELAQFAQLEQLSNINTKFDKLNPNVGVEDKFYGASFLGKEVVTSGNTVKYAGNGQKADIYYTLPEAAEKMVVRITDKNGNVVNEEWKEKVYAGQHKTYWDGDDLAGNPEKAGEYQVSVMAWDATGGKIPVETKNQGLVESVYFENGETVLIVNGKKTFLRDVDSFHVPGAKVNLPKEEEGLADQAAPAIQQALAPKREANANQAINTYKNNAPVENEFSSVYDR